ncbi:MAG TPA: hypothetical protein VFB76_08245 [Candidatus Angelobacter sp.]|nr:hypothetical protein [Candidatus Angelobacter sp.]
MKIRARLAVVLVALFCFAILSAIALMPTMREKNEKQSAAASSTANAGHGDQQPDAVACVLSDEDYAVFTGILKELGGPHPQADLKKIEILVVDITTKAVKDERETNGWNYPSKSNPAPAAETRVDFMEKSKDMCPLKENWGDPKLYKPVSSKEVSAYFDAAGKKHDGWHDFHAGHPEAVGFLLFSRPGYNSQKNEALLYVGSFCGWLCGSGHMYFLTKENGKWSVKNKLMLWIA